MVFTLTGEPTILPTLPLRIGLITSLLMLSRCGLNMFAGSKSLVIVDEVGSRVGTVVVITDRRFALVWLQENSASAAGLFCADPHLMPTRLSRARERPCVTCPTTQLSPA